MRYPNLMLALLLGAGLAGAGCAGGSDPANALDDTDDGKDDSTATTLRGSYLGKSTIEWGSGPVRFRAIVEGSRVAQLVVGKAYEFRVRKTDRMQGDLAIYRLLSYRLVLTLIGTLAEGPDQLMTLSTVRGGTYLVYGPVLDGLRNIAASRPDYELSAMLYRLTVLVRPSAPTKAELASFDNVPLYACQLTNSPVGPVYLELSQIQLDAKRLEAYEYRMLPTGEPGPIALGACDRDTDAFDCVLHQPIGSDDVYGTMRFDRPTAPVGTPFTVMVQRTDPANTQLSFECRQTDPDALIHASDG